MPEAGLDTEPDEGHVHPRLSGRSGRFMSRHAEDRHEVLSQSPLSDGKAFIRSVVKKARVAGREVSLSCTMPLAADGASEEMAGVLPTVRYGGRYCTIDRTFELVFNLPA